MHKTESAKSRGLHDNVGYNAWIAWVACIKFLCGLRGLHGSKYFLCGSFFYVGCVGQNFLCGSSFMWVKILHVSKNFVRE